MKKYGYLFAGIAFVSLIAFAFPKAATERKLPTPGVHPNQPANTPVAAEVINKPEVPPAKVKITLSSDEALKRAKLAAAGNNLFAQSLTRLYIRSKEQANKNIFFSPFSISSALGMTGEGARGETQNQILGVFHLSKVEKIRQYSALGLQEVLNNHESSYKLHTSNSLWIRQGDELNPAFMTAAQDFYRANVTFLDFKDAFKSSKTINDYVAQKTENRIKNLVSPGMINANTKLILTNTIYFKADWKWEFNAAKTYEQNFTTSDGTAKKVDMMHQQRFFNYFEDESFQALEMEYQNSEMSMIAVLPKSTDQNAIAAIDLKKTMDIAFKNEEVNVSFPKFKIETSYSLKQDLSQLGMPLAFLNADFSGISGQNDIKISAVVHKAFVEVGEKGTEAAAATAVIMEEITSVAPITVNPVKVFKADRPFIFMIRHNASGAILFMGVVNNPKG